MRQVADVTAHASHATGKIGDAAAHLNHATINIVRQLKTIEVHLIKLELIFSITLITYVKLRKQKLKSFEF